MIGKNRWLELLKHVYTFKTLPDNSLLAFSHTSVCRFIAPASPKAPAFGALSPPSMGSNVYRWSTLQSRFRKISCSLHWLLCTGAKLFYHNSRGKNPGSARGYVGIGVVTMAFFAVLCTDGWLLWAHHNCRCFSHFHLACGNEKNVMCRVIQW